MRISGSRGMQRHGALRRLGRQQDISRPAEAWSQLVLAATAANQ